MNRICRTELEDKPGYWHLDEDVIVGDTWIPKGFIWDLCSKPPWGITRALGYRAEDPRTEKAGLRHDFEYVTHKYSRWKTDSRYREQSVIDSYPIRKSWVEWSIIRTLGASHWANDKEDLKLVARMCQTWYKMGGKYAEFADYMVKACGV
jgi:hypothetical protein